MKQLQFFVLFFIFGGYVFSQKIEVNHQIDKVNVFLNGAEINRKASVQIPNGRSELLFYGISSSIVPNSIKIIFDPSSVKVISINVLDSINYKKDKQWKNIRDKLDNIEEEKKLLSIKIQSLQKQIVFLDKNMELKGNTPASVQQLNARSDYFQKKTEEIEKKIFSLKQKMKSIDKKLDETEKKLSRIEKKLQKKSSVIKVSVDTDQPVNSNLQLKYMVNNASWKPFYSINAVNKNEKINFKYQAKIYNNTGNDWNNQKLTLAIVNPSDDLSLPVLKTWTIGDFVEMQYGEGRLNNIKGKAEYTSNTNMDYDIIKVEDIHAKFDIDIPHDIPSDARPHLINVKDYDVKVDYYSLSIPKIKEGAYLIAKIPHWHQMGLMDADVNLYYNNNFQGVSHLDTEQISDTLDVSLGKDESFVVTRRKLKSANKTHMIGFNLTKKLTYEIVVKNLRNETQEIEVRDQIPVSSDSDIKIEIIDLAGAQLDDISGQLTWKIKLKALETKKIVFSFNIKVPKSKAGVLNKINDNRIRSPRFY